MNFADRRAEYPVKVHDVIISPDPVVRGEEATFKVSASTSTTLCSLLLSVSFLSFICLICFHVRVLVWLHNHESLLPISMILWKIMESWFKKFPVQWLKVWFHTTREIFFVIFFGHLVLKCAEWFLKLISIYIIVAFNAWVFCA